MNKRGLTILVVASGITLLAGVLLGRYLLPSPSGHAHDGPAGPVTDTAAADATIWTCSMHPQIQRPAPGDCPICGMDLIPLENGDSGEGARTLTMSESSRALADIETAVVRRQLPTSTVRLVGTLDYDETRERSLTARFPARVDRLFVNFTGVHVERGEHLAEVYSPDLLSAQRELLTSYEAGPSSSITQVARDKLRLWDLLPDQIDAIVESGEVREHVELRAPISGTVVAKLIDEGDYVQEGTPLYKIVDLDWLWLELEAYESDLVWLRYGQDVAFTVEALPGETFHGRVSFIEPEVARTTRTVSVRVNVPNDAGRLKPGMFARAVVESQLAAGGKVYAPELAGKWISPMHPEVVKDGPGACDVCGMPLVPAEELGYAKNESVETPLVIPSTAVLRTGKRAVVYVEVSDRERPTFEGREIELGPKSGKYYVVAGGLKEGEAVVTQGAFKIDSALQIQAKPSMMSPREMASPAEQDHGLLSDLSPNKTSAPGPRQASFETATTLLPAYLRLHSALAGDDFSGAQKSVSEMIELTGHSGSLAALLHSMTKARDLDGLRRPLFEELSESLVAALKKEPGQLGSAVFIAECPMVYPSRGARWIQGEPAVKNPYFGNAMLTCGEVVETLGESSERGAAHAQ